MCKQLCKKNWTEAWWSICLNRQWNDVYWDFCASLKSNKYMANRVRRLLDLVQRKLQQIYGCSALLMQKKYVRLYRCRFNRKRERKRSDQKPMKKAPSPIKKTQKATWQHINVNKNFDYTKIVDRLRRKLLNQDICIPWPWEVKFSVVK